MNNQITFDFDVIVFLLTRHNLAKLIYTINKVIIEVLYFGKQVIALCS